MTRAPKGQQSFRDEPAWRLTVLEAAVGALRRLVEEDILEAWEFLGMSREA